MDKNFSAFDIDVTTGDAPPTGGRSKRIQIVDSLADPRAVEFAHASGDAFGWGQLPDKGVEVAKRMSDTVGTMDAYWLAIFGDPSSGEPWQWQLEGHSANDSLSLNGRKSQ